MSRIAAATVLFSLVGSRPIQATSDERLKDGFLTVDAFDTLITRSVFHPTDVFSICALSLVERAIIDMPPSAWRDVRHHVETELARKCYPREVRLDEIYAELVRVGAILEDHKDYARDLERTIEAALSRPIAAMIRAVNQFAARGGTVKVLSDTYLPSGDVSALLLKAGLGISSSDIITSSDAGVTKRSGALFHAVKTTFAGHKGALLHVGDDFDADVRQARRAGLRAAPFVTGKPTRFEAQLRRSLQTPDLLGSVIAGSARVTRLARRLPSRHEQVIWDVSAGVSGPLLFTFVAWILREAAARGLRTVYFFARDGEVLLRIANELRPALPVPIDCKYLYISRQSIRLPGVTELGPTERAWITDRADSSSLAYLLARLDVGVDEFLPRLPANSPLRGIDPFQRMTLDDAAAVAASLDQEAIRDIILTRAVQRRRACVDYMRGMGLLAPGRIGLVDLGWKGTLQRSLCQAMSTADPGFAERVDGFYLDLDRQPADAGSFSTFSALCPDQKFSWAPRGAFFEILCAAHHGTVKRYSYDPSGKAVPDLASESNAEAEAWGLAVQQDAIVAFAREVVRNMALARLDLPAQIEPLARAMPAVVRTFVTRPSCDEAEAFGSFPHSDRELHDQEEDVAARIDFRPAALLKRFGPEHKGRRISYWPEASVARSVPRWFRSTALSLLEAIPSRRT